MKQRLNIRSIGIPLLLLSIMASLGCQNSATPESLDWSSLEATCETLWADEARGIYDDCRMGDIDSEQCQDQALLVYQRGIADNCRPCEASCALEGRIEFDLCQRIEEESELCGLLSLETYRSCNESCSGAEQAP